MPVEYILKTLTIIITTHAFKKLTCGNLVNFWHCAQNKILFLIKNKAATTTKQNNNIAYCQWLILDSVLSWLPGPQEILVQMFYWLP